MGRPTSGRRDRRRVLHGGGPGSLVHLGMAGMDGGSTRSDRPRGWRVGRNPGCCYHDAGRRAINMRAAKPDELQSHAYPVLAAAISEAELSRWFPVPFQHITDPQDAAEPSKAALVRLDAGDTFVLYYGELSNQLRCAFPRRSTPPRFSVRCSPKCRCPARASCGVARMHACRATLRRRPLPLLQARVVGRLRK